MSIQMVPRLVRTLPWADADLVEGTEALLWPAVAHQEAEAPLPLVDEAFHAVLSWVRPQVIRFETATPQPLPNLSLVSALSSAGPAQFIVAKTYQIGTTAACEPPEVVHVVERRDLFRVKVAVPVRLEAPGGSWSVSSMDCSLGGARLSPPEPVPMGTDVEVALDLGRHVVTVKAVVRHCRPYLPGQVAPAPAQGEEAGGQSVVGVQFQRLAPDAERRLSEFLGRHQRRLMPKVQGAFPVDYLPPGRDYFLETLATEVSPGDVVLRTRKTHLPGEHMQLDLRLRRNSFHLEGRVVNCYTALHEDAKASHYVRLSIDETQGPAASLYRKAVRELSLEKVALAG